MTLVIIALVVALIANALGWIMNGVDIRDKDWTLMSGVIALVFSAVLIIASTVFYDRVLIESCVIENDLRNSQTCEVIAVPVMKEKQL